MNNPIQVVVIYNSGSEFCYPHLQVEVLGIFPRAKSGHIRRGFIDLPLVNRAIRRIVGPECSIAIRMEYPRFTLPAEHKYAQLVEVEVARELLNMFDSKNWRSEEFLTSNGPVYLGFHRVPETTLGYVGLDSELGSCWKRVISVHV